MGDMVDNNIGLVWRREMASRPVLSPNKDRLGVLVRLPHVSSLVASSVRVPTCVRLVRLFRCSIVDGGQISMVYVESSVLVSIYP